MNDLIPELVRFFFYGRKSLHATDFGGHVPPLVAFCASFYLDWLIFSEFFSNFATNTRQSCIWSFVTMNRNNKICLICLLFCLIIGNIQAQEQKKPFKERFLHYLDSSNVEGTDPDYIALPEKKWCITLNSSTDQMDLDLSSHVDEIYQNIEDTSPLQTVFDFNLKIKPPVANSLGLWVGYRGWGAGYSVSLSGNKGINMSFNIATPSNGVNIRWRRFNYSKPEVRISNMSINGKSFDEDSEATINLLKPMKVESFVLDGYWIFNRRRFALASAYGQSVIQKRSAGSLIAGLMVYYQKFDMSQPQNMVILSEIFKGLGCLKIYQGNLGAGYTYNWVPVKGVLVNAVAMPVVSVFNYMKADNYSSPEYSASSNEDVDDDDFWDHLEAGYQRSNSQWGRVRLNIDVRASITYWYHNMFINAMGQIHNFSSSYEGTKIHMSNWDVKGTIGFTL